MTDRPSTREAARLLRQRLEMGAGEVVLSGMTRAEALALLAISPRQDTGRATTPEGTKTVGQTPDRTATPTGASQTTSEAVRALRDAHRPPTAAGVQAPAKETAAGRSKPSGSAAPPDATDTTPLVLPEVYDEVKEIALGCTRCRLCEGRTQVVFSDGPSDARLMVVGEAPGANEDETGVPFVGAAGKYLDLLLSTVDLSREESVYIANVLKCRPPGNRNPLPDEIEACSPYLLKQIDLVRPQALLAVGSFSGKLLTGREKWTLGKLRGTVHSYHGVPLVVTYHPAALLRNPKWTRLFWEDLQLLREVLDTA